VNTTS